MRKISMFTFLLFILLAPSVLAHSGLETSSPKSGEVVKSELLTLFLTFNTKIESTSTLKLIGEDGKEITLDDLQVQEKDLIGNLKSPLGDGEYTVVWRIIGEDGHPIENSYSFSVDTLSDTNSDDTSETIVEGKYNNTNPDISKIIEKEPSNSNNILIISVIALIIIAVISTLWLSKKGKSK
ncbi:copper resistance CopC family protein [Rummeliibacillus stabekisii]|uniref:copper resistance CopC family protein n=1 Tax=Rummeliibacillus stabekisii TaxID=241244 RepID=UPI003715438F